MTDPDKLQTREKTEGEQRANPPVVDESVLSPEEIRARAAELERVRQDSVRSEERELEESRRELGGMFFDTETGDKKKAESPEAEKRESVAEAMKEVDSFLRESWELRGMDADFIHEGRTLAMKLSGELSGVSPKDLFYRTVSQMAERAVQPIKKRLNNIEKNNQDAGARTIRTEIEGLLRKASEERDPEKIKEYTEKASHLFDELVDVAQGRRGDNGKERSNIVKISEENNGDTKKEMRKAEGTLGRGGYNIKESLIAKYATRSRNLAEFMASKSDKISKQDRVFEKNNEDRKKAFREILQRILGG